jgi:uncharacterized protein
MTTVRPAPSTSITTAADTPPVLPQQSLPTSILLHLLPGVALTAFVLLLAPTLATVGIAAPFALFLGIPLVIVPLELGYLLVYAKRTTGSFAVRGAIAYQQRLPRRQLAKLTAALAAWFLVLFVLSTAFLDDWLVERAFAWLPDAILQFSRFEDTGEPLAIGIVVGLALVAFVFNGFVGPVVEELYFRGHLLPRIERLGRWAPVLNTVLFSLYHLWTPWQNPARIAGFLPIAWTAWRRRSVQVAIAAHVTVNLLFLLLFAAALSAGV